MNTIICSPRRTVVAGSETPMARFSKAPRGTPDSSNLATENARRHSRLSHLNEFAWAAARLVTAMSVTVAIHIAALKYVFWS